MSPTAVPDQSCFLIIDPSENNLKTLPANLREKTRIRFANLDDAADLARIPRYFSTCDPTIDPSSWMSRPCEKTRKRIFDSPITESVWRNSDLAAAIKSEQRDRLIVCGFWLDVDLASVAMDAYVDGFDVHVLTDLVFSRHMEDHDDALSRLTQMGIVPITTCQLLHEWISWTSDVERSNRLQAVLDEIVQN